MQQNLRRTPTYEVGLSIGTRLTVVGWLHSWRAMGGVSFLVLRDGWGTLQMVAETEEELKPLRERGAGLESVLAVSGLVVAMPQAPGGCELHELRIEVMTPVGEAPIVPLNKPVLNAQVSTLLDHASVLNRHPARRAILRLGAGAMQAFRAVLNERRFTEIQTPKIVAAATESGANVFAVDYFGRPAYLAQKNTIVALDRGYDAPWLWCRCSGLGIGVLNRLTCNRCFYRPALPPTGKRGAPRLDGAKLQPKDAVTHAEPDGTWSGTDDKGRPVEVTWWKHMHVKATRWLEVTVLRVVRPHATDKERDPRVSWFVWIVIPMWTWPKLLWDTCSASAKSTAIASTHRI